MSPARSDASLHRFATLVACATWILLVAGGLVTSTASGLSVPDWPLSFGTLFPRMEGGVRFEHTHRLIAGTVVCLTIALTVWVSRRESRTLVRRLVFLAMGAVVLQALLGGATVLLKLPPAVSASHAGLAQLFFSLILTTAVATGPGWRKARSGGFRRARGFFAATGIAILLQILVGAVMRHTGEGMAFPDFPKSNGMWIPSLDDFGNRINYAHRVGAAVVAVLVLASAHLAWHRSAPGTPERKAGALLPLFLAAQLWLGALSIWHDLPVLVTAAHVAVAGLVFSTTVALTIRSFSRE
jgi:cytochrome c oxidase assembly protein subunit 15